MRIFVSYRRSDSQDFANALHERLAEAFGAERVFLDVATVPYGERFPAYIERAILHSDVVVVLIGSTWADVRDETGRLRLEHRRDYVRLEVEYALLRHGSQGLPVIPVTLDGVRLGGLPVPPALRGLRELGGIELPNADAAAVDTVVEALEQRAATLETRADPLPAPRPLEPHVDIEQQRFLFGGPLQALPDDAVIRLWPRGEGWSVAIESALHPTANRRRGSLGTGPMHGEDAHGATGALVEWFDVSPAQVLRWLPNPAFRRGWLGFGGSRGEPEGRFVAMTGVGTPFANLHRLLLEFDREIGARPIAPDEEVPRDGAPVPPQLGVYGRLHDEENRRFGTYIGSLTQALGGTDQNGDLVLLPTVPGTRLQVLDARHPLLVDGVPLRFRDVRLHGHIGRDDSGFHIVWLPS